MNIEQLNSAEELINKHRLDQPNWEFNREVLLSDMDELLVRYMLKATVKREAKGGGDNLIYPEFCSVVSQVREMFNNISRIKEQATGYGLTESLWKAFFAKYVVKHRGKLYPEIQVKISQSKTSNNNTLCQVKK